MTARDLTSATQDPDPFLLAEALVSSVNFFFFFYMEVGSAVCWFIV